MTLEQRKKLLFDYKLSLNDDFYVLKDEFSEKLILRRTGIDKVQAFLKMAFTVESIQTVSYGTKCCTTILGKGSTPDGDHARTTASANPDNCKFPNYAEVAEKRCRHRLILQLARLYQYDIYSDCESDVWNQSKNDYGSAVASVQKALKVQ